MANNNKSTNSTASVEKKNSKKKKPSKVGRFFKKFFLTIVILGLICLVVGLGYIFAVIKTAPDLDVNAVLSLNETSMLYDSNGDFIDNLPTEEERYVITYDQIPQTLVNAYIAIEDERFLTHKGIDVRRIAGAAVRDVIVTIKGEGGIHGASTITQQLIKNTILIDEASSESTMLDSVNRKIKEIYLSLQLEKKLSKEQIITAYLNTIPLGGYIYGVEAASQYYFAKSAIDLTLPEAAYIAGITQAPTYYSAYNTEVEGYPETYKDRTKTVLMKMLELGMISQSEYDDAYATVDANEFNFSTIVNDYKVNYEWFVYPALDQVRENLKEKYKYTDEEVSRLFATGGLKIYTTLDTAMQDKVQAVINDRANYDIGNEEGYTDEGVLLLQASTTIIDYRTGQVKAIIGGRGDQPAGSLNRAYDDLKSIASNTKPLTVYGPAIDTKLMTAATPIDDAPLAQSFLDKYGYSIVPTNYNGVYDGIINPRIAITYSKNITSLKTVDMLGLDVAKEYGEKLGLVYSDNSNTLSALALGQFYNDVADRDGGNTTILASAFGTFGNGGTRVEPTFYTKVVDASGNVLLDGSKTDKVEVFSPQTAYIMYDILKEPVSNFDSSAAKFGDIPVAGKSGTTDAVDSFWFSGLTPYYSASVWIGYDTPTPLSGYSSAAAKLWGKVMQVVHEGLEYKELDKPDGLVQVAVCQDSGKLPTDLCKRDQRGSRVVNEYFISGTEPNTYCDVHTEAKVNKQNNKLATDSTPTSLLETRVFIKKDHPDSNTADYKYVLPIEKDDTKKITLSNLGVSKNMDLYDVIKILNANNISYKFKDTSVSGTIKYGEYTVTNFTSEIASGGTVTLTIKKVATNNSSANNNSNNNNNANNNNTNNNNENGNNNNHQNTDESNDQTTSDNNDNHES